MAQPFDRSGAPGQLDHERPQETTVGAFHPGCVATEALTVGLAGVDRTLATQLADKALREAPCKNDLRCVMRAMSVLLIARSLAAVDDHCTRLTGTLGPAADGIWPLIRAQIARLAGDLDGARRGLDELIAPGNPRNVRQIALAWQLETLIRAGELAQAQALAHAHDLDRLVTLPSAHRPLLLAARGTVRLAERRFAEALADFTGCGDAHAADHMPNQAVLHWRAMAAFAAQGAGRPDLARALAEGEHEAAMRCAAPAGVGYALYARGMVAGRPKDALLMLTDAVNLLEVAGARVELATVCLELGRRLVAAGDLELAEPQLERAAELARQIGNKSLVTEIEEELRNAGTAPSRASLTPQETRIAKLARASHSNKDIAAKLNLTVRTVEFHLSSVYRKLHVSGRRELISRPLNLG
ncbi:helix-turn-helix transcriptional regulator [Amycolatopsis sp. WQ 127309]|uniref:helix-turn-helix transcriptional regulator n=1 Tax=Amycolatopsis sp. WQ 127309 TaxID=2932773 RepID=UPI001FF12BD1|nr:helix-turn-helix transcriptional regulator [Amycolatopsis sp. WQ 127309]UOZ06968.1 helix-turn-helix transcriptional regulator [Amycolatopsis sp. WQ 127309]